MKMSAVLQQAVGQKLFRAVDAQFAMMLASDEQPGVMLSAALVSHDSGEGHVWLPLSRLSPEYCFAGRQPELAEQLFAVAGTADWVSTLLASPAVIDNDEPTPLKLIGDRLYLN
ncbi:MAG: exodeoxyribonuclease V subunit alpha, partial [Ewingella sp.]|nr:exodeoxyribonuclease V subunit alpha [Ewingella sp.]